MKWEKAVNKIVTARWLRSEHTKRKYRQRMKKMWDEIGIFPVTEQRLADQAREIRTNKWLTDIEIEEIERQLGRHDSTVEVQEDEQEIIKRNENEQPQLEEQRAQEVLVEQGHVSKQQQETYRISLFPYNDEILVRKAEMKRCSEEEKELLRRMVKEIRCDPEKIPPILRYIDRKKVRAATANINKIVSLIKTETITETKKMVGFKSKQLTGNRQPSW